MNMATLDSFLGLPTSPAPESIATSQEIRDRGSTFVATIYPASCVKAARAAITHVRNVVHRSKPASHEISAWRCMVLKEGKSGLDGPNDFEVQVGSDDDGEQYAGAKVLKVMQDEGVIDAVVIASRWYGGIMLGPVRFTHFETCAREVCRTFRLKDEMTTFISTLSSLDDILASLRDELAQLTSSDTAQSALKEVAGASSKKTPDYTALQESMDLNKVKRLIIARENSIKSVKIALKKKRDQMT